MLIDGIVIHRKIAPDDVGRDRKYYKFSRLEPKQPHSKESAPLVQIELPIESRSPAYSPWFDFQ